MTKLTLLLKNNKVRIFDNFFDDEGMGCFYDDAGTLLCIDYANHEVFVEDNEGEHYYKYESILVN